MANTKYEVPEGLYPLTDAEAARVDNLGGGSAAVDRVLSERVGLIGFPIGQEGPLNVIPGGHQPPPPTQPQVIDGVCPTCGQALPDPSTVDHSLTAAEAEKRPSGVATPITTTAEVANTENEAQWAAATEANQGV